MAIVKNEIVDVVIMDLAGLFHDVVARAIQIVVWLISCPKKPSSMMWASKCFFAWSSKEPEPAAGS